MKDFLMATIGGLGISFICCGPYIIICLILMKNLEKQEKRNKK